MCVVVVSFTDGERPMEGTDTSRKRDSRSSDKHHKNEDASNSQEDENTVRLFVVVVWFFLPKISKISKGTQGLKRSVLNSIEYTLGVYTSKNYT